MSISEIHLEIVFEIRNPFLFPKEERIEEIEHDDLVRECGLTTLDEFSVDSEHDRFSLLHMDVWGITSDTLGKYRIEEHRDNVSICEYTIT